MGKGNKNNLGRKPTNLLTVVACGMAGAGDHKGQEQQLANDSKEWQGVPWGEAVVQQHTAAASRVAGCEEPC